MPPLRRTLTVLLLAALLAPALLLTGLRLAQPGWGWALRTVSFAPYAVPCYAAAASVLLGTAVAAVRRRLGVRPVAARLCALLGVLALLVVHVSWALPGFTGSPPQAAPGSPRLRVMTLNVLHDAGTGAVVRDAVSQADADVVALQEMTRTIWRQLAGTDLLRTHPHVAGLRGDDRTDEPGTVVLSRSPLGRPERLGTDGDSLVVPVRLGQRTIELMAVHPRNPLHPMLWREDHAAMAEAVRRIRPAVVAGDFNATYDHAPMRVYRRLGYRSAAEIRNSGWAPTWPNNGHRELLGVSSPRLVHIDHVMVARGFTVVSVEHLDVPLTDHMGVVAEVAVR